MNSIPAYLSITSIIYHHHYLSLKAKLRACVGKYLITLAKLPRQKDKNPCSFGILTKQSTIPEKFHQNTTL